MHLFFSPLAVAISSSIFLSSTVLAASVHSGGAAGTTDSYDENQFSQGKPGTDDPSFSAGQDGGNITGIILSPDHALNGAPGSNGQDAGLKGGGAGAGGQGGGSLFGGFSSGGSGGVATEALSTRGGNGGDISGNTVTFTQTLTGTVGGNGGSSAGGGGGAGGSGGGSAYGGFSSGGAGGYSDIATGASPPALTSSGGRGGDVTQNALSLTNASLEGANGGDGGASDTKGGGGVANGGEGGGSVIGGVSAGGAGGRSSHDDLGSALAVNGGVGGSVIANTITLTSTDLTGGDGGHGAITTGFSQGGAGSGGNGGGSVLGGLSIGGSAGYASQSSTLNGGNGGDGGEITANRLTLTDIVLTGAQGGQGGSTSVGGGGNGGQGGGSLFGGLSSAGAGGYVEGSSTANGGDGGKISSNIISVDKAVIHGGTGGSAGGGGDHIGEEYSVGNGIAGNGGGSVFGGLSNAGAGGGVEEGGADGGQGGEVTGNAISLIHTSLIGGVGGNAREPGRSNDSSGIPESAGHGGGSVFGGISNGGAGGGSANGSAVGGSGGNVSKNTISLTTVTLLGAAAGESGSYAGAKETVLGGYGGGSIVGGLSSGGLGGIAEIATGGSGGNIFENTISLTDTTLTGGAGGQGGGSIFGGVSRAGAGGYSDSNGGAAGTANADGGNGGHITSNTVIAHNATLIGAAGSGALGASFGYGGNGISGNGGGSVFGGLSLGGAGGFIEEGSAAGGHGGDIVGNTVTLTKTDLIGAVGGSAKETDSENGNTGIPAPAGNGGGSVFGGLSHGGAGGIGAIATGGNGGNVSRNLITLTDVNLTGAAGGATGSRGYGGGSVFGGLSNAGASSYLSRTATSSATGGNGGGVSANTITLNRATLIGAAGSSGGEGSYSEDGKVVGGEGGDGGGSVYGAVSNGGVGGWTGNGTAAGGHGGEVTGNTLTLTDTRLTGGLGGNGRTSEFYSRVSHGAAGGHGGGSVFGGISNGGGGGNGHRARGGDGGHVSGNAMTLINVDIAGAKGGVAGETIDDGHSASGADGGGSLFAGVSRAGAGGTFSRSVSSDGNVSGGTGGKVSSNTLTVSGTTITGAAGSHGGAGTYDEGGIGVGGNGGYGGGSVFGGISHGGAGGYIDEGVATGGHGSDVTGNAISLTDTTLVGAVGGNGSGNAEVAGAGGHGGGSVFGGVSRGGAGGVTQFGSATAGNGGDVTGNVISLTGVTLEGAAGGMAGTGAEVANKNLGAGINVSAGLDGGSIFGGLSSGGAGGFASESADGGNGGNTSNNTISLSGASSLSGNIYGGYSQGGTVGIAETPGQAGQGGLAQNNTVTLNGTQLSIEGAVYGGQSLSGEGIADASNAFSGNTLNLNGYRGSLKGIYNFEQYNWLLPKDVVNRDTLITITGPDKVDLNNTQHTVAMVSDGTRLNEGDKVVLIDKAQGASSPTNVQVEQGHFIIYDARLGIENDAFVLNIDGKSDTTPSNPTPAGKLNPKSESFLQGRAAALAFTNQGTDMVRDSLNACVNDMFFITDGGTNRYDTGSHIRVRDFKMALGLRTCFELQNTSKIVFGGFIDHGQGNYDSYNSFAGYGAVRGGGDLRYTGAGLLFHMDVAGTAINANTKPVAGSQEGLYLDAVARAGKVKADFASHDLVDAQGVRGEYNTQSQYLSAMAGIGYAFKLDDKQSVDVYSRYSWSRVSADKVMIGNDKLSFDSDNSSRLRAGTRYTYAVTEYLSPYAGIAYEHEFDGKVSGKAYDMSIKGTDLGGSTGIVEVGLSSTPIASVSAIKLDVGVHGFMGERRGATGSISLSYEF